MRWSQSPMFPPRMLPLPVLRFLPVPLLFVLFATSPAGRAEAQSEPLSRARVFEGTRTLDTYPFSDPDPVPMAARDRRLYPYHAFDGYAATAEPRQWQVVTLENDLIEVFVLPQVGGKVWGAVVKETGHEFVYRNEVMKFRNIALRGPWTSGGIEFNFGVIGHTPATATPVDYVLRENDDGSASVFVGTMDLPSRTHWRVEVRLPPDRAYFETRVLWYNPTPLEQPYYNWMTAAAFARDDLELFVPGRSYLEHSGRQRPWPEDESGRYLPLYRNNAFEGHKSYHVVGELNDFFGGYYHDEDWGWGHWARHEEMPGQKMWLWALSREGGVWEELLTDTDGQYVEFQAGRLLVQYSPAEHANPVAQAAFDPLSASRWTETWFPLEGTGGLTEASREGALHARHDGNRLSVTVNAFGEVEDTLQLWLGGRRIAATPVRLSPLVPFTAHYDVAADQSYRIRLDALDLDYDSDPSARILSRPFETPPDAWASVSEADRRAFEAGELARARRYREARLLFDSALDEEPWHRDALLGAAELALRSAHYQKGLDLANRALELNTYDPKANFLAGNVHFALGRTADARDSFGWAGRSMAYRAASYARLGQIEAAEEDWDEAARYAKLALDFDRRSIPALRLLAIGGRRGLDHATAERARAALLETDPLHHFVLAEEYLSELQAVPAGARPPDGEPPSGGRLLGTLRSEYPDQSLLELAVGYAALGLAEDALAVLDLALDTTVAPKYGGPVTRAWRAFLADDATLLADPADPAFAFPYRPETLPVLRWAANNHDHWVWTYLLGLNLWALDRDEEAAQTIASLADSPDYGPAYVARGHLLHSVEGRDPQADFARAVELDPDSRLLWIVLVRHALEAADWEAALEASAQARQAFPDDFNLELLHARALLAMDRPQEAAEIMDQVQVLPSENARESHSLYVLAHAATAVSELEADDHRSARTHLEAALQWPESLGQGRPYEPDERLVRYLLAVADQTAGDEPAARRSFEAVTATASMAEASREPDRAALLVALALRATDQFSGLETLADAAQDHSSAVAVAVRTFADNLANPTATPSDAAARLVQDHAALFEDLEGRLLASALTLAK